ncbi:hypothetical protein A2Z53_02875 [Candidatus Giovannonibacteria bacterium RIFCSPHIGHO2_02_42_15]|uniref:Uncharacterized protein n=2 Tax=Candidatus Giovannoniibacteriota TaxID=1752738 RepID=A0A1F5VPK4_9BACT|nr:MAG: hypothetical protein UV11_C0016G0030 [Candidatus Giovannonibacteria bacterium GW2011_GWF2_42_19]OGF65283.1 MAG: hypothetical protein A2Z53_02875 [Candidatus Giovannonibacteria bacterium RIFCSPHIGHO2_02_42_15]
MSRIDNRSLRELEQQNLLERLRWIFVDLAKEIEEASDREGVGDRVLIWLAARALNMAATASLDNCGEPGFVGFPETGLSNAEGVDWWKKSSETLADSFERISKFSRIKEEELHLTGKFAKILLKLGSRHFHKAYPPLEMEKCERLYDGRPGDPASPEAARKALHFNVLSD